MTEKIKRTKESPLRALYEHMKSLGKGKFFIQELKRPKKNNVEENLTIFG